MADNLGKKFEEKFKQDWKSSVPDSFIYRLNDQMSGYRCVSQNISDFLCYKQPNLFCIEVKSHKGSSIPFDAIPQYERLITAVDIPGVRAGVVVWLYEKDLVFYCPAKTIKQLIENGEKSVGTRHFDKYRIIQIPSIKLRTFMNSDYSVLLNLNDGD